MAMQPYADKKNYRVNGFDAKVLDEHKVVSFYHEGGHEAIEVPVDGRVTKKQVEKMIEGLEGVETVYVRHYRYLNYRLRTVMTERSGSYEVWVKMTVENGKVVSSKREIKNEMY
jgi:hypothetical protein